MSVDGLTTLSAPPENRFDDVDHRTASALSRIVLKDLASNGGLTERTSDLLVRLASYKPGDRPVFLIKITEGQPDQIHLVQYF